MADLVQLARRLVMLDDEAAKVRAEIKAVVLNGGSEAPPFSPKSMRPPDRPQKRTAIMEQAAKADEAVVGLLRAKPMTTAEIVAATQGKQTTVQNRLRRLMTKGLVERAGSGWSVTLSP
jgi:hypothetical protein